MTERPIIFSGPMVRAILDGTKTQTRRVLKPQPAKRANITRTWPASPNRQCVDGLAWFCDGGHPKHHACEEYEYSVRLGYAPGDRLWVKEAAWICPPDWTDTPANPMGPHNQEVAYAADDVRGGTAEAARDYNLRLRPLIYMPRWASRISLLVTGVRVQRLQEISGRDAAAEGCQLQRWVTGDYGFLDPGIEADNRALVSKFRDLWDTINAKRPGCSWQANPWVAAVTFERVT